MTEKKSLVEEAILQMKNLEEAVAENAKGILASTMRQEIKDLVKESLKEQLAKNTLEVLFTKKDGEQRRMTCTTMAESIPDEFKPKGLITEDIHPTQVRAYDINAEGWRSFLVTNVLEVKII